MSFGENLRSKRKAAGLTQSELGEKLGVGKTTIINWEQGKTVPKNKKLYNAINDILRVDIKKEDPVITEPSDIVGLVVGYLVDENITKANKAELFIGIQNAFINYVSTSYPAG